MPIIKLHMHLTTYKSQMLKCPCLMGDEWKGVGGGGGRGWGQGEGSDE